VNENGRNRKEGGKILSRKKVYMKKSKQKGSMRDKYLPKGGMFFSWGAKIQTPEKKNILNTVQFKT
jgi:hypothetical protein